MGLRGSKKNAPEIHHSSLNGLYPTCNWDAKIIKKFIIEKKVAPLYKGNDKKILREMDECPICFLYYPGGLNRAKCCKKEICTECFFQIKKPTVNLSISTEDSICPFCNREHFTIVYYGAKSEDERKKEEDENRRVKLLQRKVREEEMERDRKREEELKKKTDKKLKKKNKTIIHSNADKNENGKDKEKLKLKEEKERENVDKLKKEKLIIVDDNSHNNNNNPASSSSSSSTNKKKYNTKEDFISDTEDDSYDDEEEDDYESDEEDNQRKNSNPENDLEQMMLMEAIRLSLIDTPRRD